MRASDIDSELSPDDWITRIAALPLIDQPGAEFHFPERVTSGGCAGFDTYVRLRG